MKTLNSKSISSVGQKGIGGKARNLLVLHKLGIRTAPWMVIPEEILLQTADLQRNIPFEEAKEKIENARVPSRVLDEIAAFFDEDANLKTYAVRSSAIDEDGAQHSFAGQFETVLNVALDDVEAAIKRVWQSVTARRVLQYRKEHGLQQHFGIAVIIQEMLVSQVSGVAFGIDPVSGNPDTKVIAAVWGIGEGLVSGTLNADNYTITPGGIAEKIAHKSHEYLPHKSGKGLEMVAVAAEKCDVPTLNSTEIAEISKVLELLKKHFGTPQDVEFAICKGKLYVLQTRPITTKTNQNAEYILWDNSNIVESYPGVTTPLTFAFITKMYAAVYRNFVALLGVSKTQIAQHNSVFINTLGLVRGRVYYNLLSWYKMLAMVPGYSINARFMEDMMGVKERFDLSEKFTLTKTTARFRLVFMVLKLLWLHATLPRARKRFRKHLDKTMSVYQALDFGQLSAKQIISHYKNFETTLVKKWDAPLTNDFFAMIWFGVLQKLTYKYAPNSSPNLHNDLLCSSRDIISTQPIHHTMAIVTRIKKNYAAKMLFQTATPTEIWNALCNRQHVDIKQDIDLYLNLFGERCIGELKLETESLSQNPILYINTLKAYVAQGIDMPHTDENLENNIRISAEKQMHQALQGKWLKRLFFNFTLKKAREMVSERENLRFERTRGFGMVRKMFGAIGTHLHKNGWLQNPKDVFYLTLDELLVLNDQPLSGQTKTMIMERSAEFEAYKKQPEPMPRFYTYGHDFADHYIYSEEKLMPKQNELKGTGACPGKVKAKAQVVHNPLEVSHLHGDILVTTSTDPGWITLFPTASAILVERGSLLSHSAIVSRELGIPCIVGINNLLNSVKTGDYIELDGSTGLLKIVPKP